MRLALLFLNPTPNYMLQTAISLPVTHKKRQCCAGSIHCGPNKRPCSLELGFHSTVRKQQQHMQWYWRRGEAQPAMLAHSVFWQVGRHQQAGRPFHLLCSQQCLHCWCQRCRLPAGRSSTASGGTAPRDPWWCREEPEDDATPCTGTPRLL